MKGMPPACPELTGLLESALYVDDLERSAGFYARVFGFARLRADERMIAIAVKPGQVLLLFRKGGSLAQGHDGDGRLHLAFAVPAAALDAWERWLLQNGVPIEDRKAWPLGGRSLYFRDPDQHLLELATPGTWAIY